MTKYHFLCFLLLPLLLFAQTKPLGTKVVKGQITEYLIGPDNAYHIRGKVTDEKDNPLLNARVMVKNGASSSATDTQGNYSIKVNPDDKALLFYYPGKEWTEVPVLPNSLVVDAILKTDTGQYVISRRPSVATQWFDPRNDHPVTFCNPVNIDYDFETYDCDNTKRISCRSTADPMIVPYKGKYYLFCTNQSGYYVSDDLTRWRFIFSSFQRKPHDDDQCAPTVELFGDTLVMLGSTYADLPVWYTTDPQSGRWKHLAETALLPHWDPYLFLDDDGKLYLYYGSSNEFPLKGVEYDRATFRPKGIIKDLVVLHPELHGWERFGMNNDDSVTLKPFAEGSYMTKHQGKYYLQYGAPGTEFKIYADGVYVSDKPLGPFTYQQHNPFSYKPGGFVQGAGHGGTFKDNFGNYWHVATCMLSLRETFERRIGLYPAGFDNDGVMYANTAYGDYPAYIPNDQEDHQKGNFTGWMLLSYHKKVWASSTDSIFVPENAADENMRTYWAAKSNKPGEWLAMDLGGEKQVYAIQVNYYEHKANQWGKAMDIYHQYRIYRSMDGKSWELVVDKSDNDQDVPHDYIELKQPVTARYLKIENIHTPSGNFALMDLRVFGKGNGQKPEPVQHLSVNRDNKDTRNVLITWKSTPTAYGYNLYYGTAPGKLYNCITIYNNNSYDMRGLDKGTNYYFSIEALSENGVSKRSGVVMKKE
jgi:hypothetical protein